MYFRILDYGALKSKKKNITKYDVKEVQTKQICKQDLCKTLGSRFDRCDNVPRESKYLLLTCQTIVSLLIDQVKCDKTKTT